MVDTASYEARPITVAKRLCPQAIILPVREYNPDAGSKDLLVSERAGGDWWVLLERIKPASGGLRIRMNPDTLEILKVQRWGAPGETQK